MKKAIFMGWADTPHLDKSAQEALMSSYSVHERDARTKGIPQLGSGAIYPVPESAVVVVPFDIPAYWPRAYGLDVGWNRTAAIFGAHDRDSDIVYLYSEHYRGGAEPSVHADAIQARGKWLFGAVDPAGLSSSQVDGRQLIPIYENLGLHLTQAENSRESGLLEVLQRLSSGRLKVFSTCQNWLMEFRLYRRDEKGQIIKERDHLMDAMRYLIVSGLSLMTLPPDYLQRLGHKTGQVISDYNPIGEEAFA